MILLRQIALKQFCGATLIALTLASSSVLHAQLSHEGPAKAIALSQTLPPYDVVTVKLNKTGDGSSGMGIHGDTLTATNVPLSMVIEFAYDLKADMVTGLSGPVNSAHFDIQAKVLPADDGTQRKLNDTQMEAMLIELLADRFHLKAHLESRILPVYELVVARGGSRMKLSQEERTGTNWNQSDTNNNKVLTAKSASMDDLAQALSDEVHRQVINKTALTGSTDITLKWADDIAAEQGGANVISIFTAVQDQLGLKLQPSKGPVDTLVIDHIEMPTEN
jgi:bla regulator protein BlaR1